MKTFRATVRGISPYSQNRHYVVPKLNDGKESADAYERRTWRERLHVDTDGYVFIPAGAFKNCLSEAAKFISIQIPNKGKSTYTKHFVAGLFVPEGIRLNVKAADVPCNELFLPASGKAGDGKRVNKLLPRIDEWGGSFNIFVLDEIITQEVLRKHLIDAGSLIGIGNFRPRNNGYYGRFKVDSLIEIDDGAAAEAAE